MQSNHKFSENISCSCLLQIIFYYVCIIVYVLSRMLELIFYFGLFMEQYLGHTYTEVWSDSLFRLRYLLIHTMFECIINTYIHSIFNTYMALENCIKCHFNTQVKRKIKNYFIKLYNVYQQKFTVK